MPIAQAAPTRHAAAAIHLLGQILPRATRLQHKEDAGQASTVRNPRPSSLGLGRLGGKKWLDLFPQRVRQQRLGHSVLLDRPTGQTSGTRKIPYLISTAKGGFVRVPKGDCREGRFR